MSDLALRPLSLGELLDRALVIFRGRAGGILAAMLVALVMPLLMIANKVSRIMAIASVLQHDPRNAAAYHDATALMGGMLWIGVVGLVAFVVARTAVAWIVHKALLGDRADAFEGLEKGIRFAPPMLGLLLVEGAIYVAVMGALYLAGAVLVLGGLRSGTPPGAVPLILWVLSIYGAMVFLTTGLFATSSILLAESDAKVFGTIARSFALTQGRRRIIFGGILAMMVVSSIVYFGLAFGASLLLGSGAVESARLTPVLFGADVVVNLVVMSYYFIFQMAVYYDLRIRKEGLDEDLAGGAPAAK